VNIPDLRQPGNQLAGWLVWRTGGHPPGAGWPAGVMAGGRLVGRRGGRQLPGVNGGVASAMAAVAAVWPVVGWTTVAAWVAYLAGGGGHSVARPNGRAWRPRRWTGGGRRKPVGQTANPAAGWRVGGVGRLASALCYYWRTVFGQPILARLAVAGV